MRGPPVSITTHYEMRGAGLAPSMQRRGLRPKASNTFTSCILANPNGGGRGGWAGRRAGRFRRDGHLMDVCGVHSARRRRRKATTMDGAQRRLRWRGK